MPPRAKTTEGGTKKEKKPAAPRKPKKAKAEPGSVGLTADEVASGSPTAEVGKLRGKIGAKTTVALVMPEPEIAFRILALNTEKAHNLKDKALEVIRMARAIAEDGDRSESDVAFELEQASLVTIGVCYEKNTRFSGGAYNSVVSKCESFSTEPMKKSLKLREAHADN